MSNANQESVLLFCYERENRNSVGALVHALECAGLARPGGQADSLAIERSDFASAPEHFARHREGAQRIIAAFSFMTCQLGRVEQAFAQMRALKRPGDLFLAGGPHATALPEASLRLGFDVVFIGEAEGSFPEFVRSVLEKEEWRGVGGIAWHGDAPPVPDSVGDGDGEAGGEVRTNPPASVPALDDCWTCARRLGITAPLEITRGCFFACTYCFTPHLFARGGVRHRSIESAVSLAGRYRQYVSFLSPNAFSYGATKRGEVNVAAIVRLLSSIREAHAELEINFGAFPSEVRPEYVSRELIREIKPLISNRYITVGAQSASDRVLRAVAREHTAADIVRAIEIIRGEGLQVLVDLIFGLPGEERADVQASRRLIERFIPNEVRFRIHRFAPLPGTPFAAAPHGRIDPDTREFLLHGERTEFISGEWQE